MELKFKVGDKMKNKPRYKLVKTMYGPLPFPASFKDAMIGMFVWLLIFYIISKLLVYFS